MVLKYFYTEFPSVVRIKSESLCMDHTFVPGASSKPVSLDYLCKLSHEDHIDCVFALIPKAAKAYYIDSINNEKISIYFWEELSVFDAAEPYS